MARRRYLVTGSLGCIGAWTAYHLVKRSDSVVSLDLYDRGHRLDYLLTPEEQKSITFVKGDISDFRQVIEAFRANGVTHVIHLAALQVPFCRADPVKGAQVNVVGAINIFEAAHEYGIGHVAYASSVAVYGPPSLYPPGAIQHDALPAPATLYGVYKQDNEGSARVYWQDHQLSSTGLRPHTVYGVGRDQGVTSDPTKAMLAAAAGKPFEIKFKNRMQMQSASDVAQQFIEAATTPLGGAYVFNLGGEVVSMARVIEMIQQIKPNAAITHSDAELPFVSETADAELRRCFSKVYQTPLAEGIQQTMTRFEQYLRDGRIKVEG
jgi:nucleoside-diphosphate-sugar epimerase